MFKDKWGQTDTLRGGMWKPSPIVDQVNTLRIIMDGQIPSHSSFKFQMMQFPAWTSRDSHAMCQNHEVLAWCSAKNLDWGFQVENHEQFFFFVREITLQHKIHGILTNLFWCQSVFHSFPFFPVGPTMLFSWIDVWCKSGWSRSRIHFTTLATYLIAWPRERCLAEVCSPHSIPTYWMVIIVLLMLEYHN